MIKLTPKSIAAFMAVAVVATGMIGAPQKAWANTENKPVQMDRYLVDGENETLSSTTKAKYNNKALVMEEEFTMYYDKKKPTTEKTKYQYNKYGLVTKSITYDGNGKFSSKHVAKYNKKRLMKTSEYMADYKKAKKAYSTTTYKYNTKGLCIKEQLKCKGKKCRVVSHKYDKKKRLVKTTKTEARYKEVTKYYYSGKTLLKTVTTFPKQSSSSDRVKKITYYENNCIAKVVDEGSDLTRTTEYYTSGDLKGFVKTDISKNSERDYIEYSDRYDYTINGDHQVTSQLVFCVYNLGKEVNKYTSKVVYKY